MRRDELIQFLRRYELGVLATVAPDDLEVVLDTLDSRASTATCAPTPAPPW